MQFRRQNSDESETGPLSPAKAREQLLAGVLNRRLNAVDGGDRQWITSH
jgi:hypothetical protein